MWAAAAGEKIVISKLSRPQIDRRLNLQLKATKQHPLVRGSLGREEIPRRIPAQGASLLGLTPAACALSRGPSFQRLEQLPSGSAIVSRVCLPQDNDAHRRMPPGSLRSEERRVGKESRS